MLMEARERTYTVDEFLALVESLPADDRRDYELIQGEIVELPASLLWKPQQPHWQSLLSENTFWNMI